MGKEERYYRVLNAANMKAWMVTEPELADLKGKTSHFISTCYYNKNQYETFNKTKSVAGVTDVKTNQLWFDFDSKDLNLALNDTRELCDRLSYHFDDNNIECFFSGNKGFHVIVKLNEEINPQQVKKIVSKLGVNLPTLDMKIYDAARILRATNTKNEKSGLYKVQLFPAELAEYAITQIQQMALEPRDFTNYKTIPANIPKELLIEEIPKAEVKIDITDPLKIKEIDFTQKPFGWKDYKWSLAQGRFEIGSRNNSQMTIAATCRALKYGIDHTRAICEAADKLHCEITGDVPMNGSDLEFQVLNPIFSESWKGGQYSSENNLELRNYCQKYGFDTNDKQDPDVITICDVNSTFKDFVINIDKNTIKTGIRSLDEKVPITVGMNLGLIGAASSGKTAIALEILKNTSMAGVVSVIASLDMHRNRLFEKILYKVSGDVFKKTLTRTELYSKYQNNEDSPLVDEIKRQFGNVYFYDRSRPTVADLKKFIEQIERQTGQKVKLLLVDYFERIGSDVVDTTASSLKVASELQDLINDLNIAIITLVQPNKFSLTGGPDCPILNYTAIKGSSFLYQSFRSIISIWRPFFNPKTTELDKFLEMAILKNDLGEQDSFKFNWDGKTGSITEISEENKLVYDQFMEKKQEINSAKLNAFGQFRKPQ
jgi:DnaB-like helicase C terminal domain